jgi:hypothetical protein
MAGARIFGLVVFLVLATSAVYGADYSSPDAQSSIQGMMVQNPPADVTPGSMMTGTATMSDLTNSKSDQNSQDYTAASYAQYNQEDRAYQTDNSAVLLNIQATLDNLAAYDWNTNPALMQSTTDMQSGDYSGQSYLTYDQQYTQYSTEREKLIQQDVRNMLGADMYNKINNGMEASDTTDFTGLSTEEYATYDRAYRLASIDEQKNMYAGVLNILQNQLNSAVVTNQPLLNSGDYQYNSWDMAGAEEGLYSNAVQQYYAQQA